MDQVTTAYTITFPMVMSGALALAGGLLAWFVRKWLSDSEKAQDTKDVQTHESFQVLHSRIDKLRDQREADLEKAHALELQLTAFIKREELMAMREEIKQDVHAGTAQVIAVVQAMKGTG